MEISTIYDIIFKIQILPNFNLKISTGKINEQKHFEFNSDIQRKQIIRYLEISANNAAGESVEVKAVVEPR